MIIDETCQQNGRARQSEAGALYEMVDFGTKMSMKIANQGYKMA